MAAYLAPDLEGEQAQRIRKAYSAQPLDTPDEWGDLGSFLDEVRSTRVVTE